MSVASKNLFALLDDDAPDSGVAVPSKAPEPVPTTQEAPPRNQRGRGGATSRGGRYYQRGGKPSSTPAPENEDSTPESRPARADGEAGGRGRGRGRGRGGRGGNRGGPPRRGREFDRQSGTLPDSDKRVHQGWGGDDGERELQNEEQAVADANAETTAVTGDWASPNAGATDDWAGTTAPASNEWDAPPAQENTTAEVVETNQKESGGEVRRRRVDDEEEDNTLTLDQYLAKQKSNVSDLLPKLEGRKANEGAQDDLWKNAVQVEKNSEDSYFVGKVKTAPKARAKKADKEIIDIEPRFERPSRGGRGRGRGGADDRRGAGRGRGRGGDRFEGRGNSSNPTLNVDDQSAFPSLG